MQCYLLSVYALCHRVRAYPLMQFQFDLWLAVLKNRMFSLSVSLPRFVVGWCLGLHHPTLSLTGGLVLRGLVRRVLGICRRKLVIERVMDIHIVVVHLS